MDTLVKFNNQTVGRDRIIRLLQYGSKLLWSLSEKATLDRELVVKLKNLEYSLSTARKLLRLGRFVDTLYGAMTTIHLPDTADRISLTMARINQAFYLLTDHILWVGRMGLIRVDNNKWSIRSNKFWLSSVLFALLRDLHELWDVTKRPSQSPDISAVCHRKDLVVDIVKNGCDIWLPMSNLGYVNLSPGMIGLLGVISSVAGILSIINPKLKLVPS